MQASTDGQVVAQGSIHLDSEYLRAQIQLMAGKKKEIHL
jgi:DNA-binding cell septation regulator SpoVG